ncbi:MAG: hypothetical protein ABIQ40_17265 [Bacteroidia bacterium]
MTALSAIGIFSFCFVLMTFSSFVLSNSLGKLKRRYNISGGILGMLVALSADAPEISSVIVALFAKQKDVGIGIVVGSNIFNLAAILGLSTLFAGRLQLKRSATIFNGAVSLIALLIMILLVFKFISPLLSVILFLLVLVPYVIISGLNAEKMKRWSFPLKIRNFITDATTEIENDKTPMPKSWSWVWIGGIALIAIVFSSMGIVSSAVFLSGEWNINKTILGVIVLASLTGIPNMITAIKMALQGKDVVVMNEALNSNNLNIFFGACIPSLLFGVSTLSEQTVFSVWWLLGITIMNLLLLYFMNGFNRVSGILSIVLYLVFLFIMIR